MAFPTTVLSAPAVAIEGMIAERGDPFLVDSGLAADIIAPGRFVCRQAADADNQFRLPDSAADVQGGGGIGVSFYDALAPSNPYAVGEAVGACYRGVLWVIVEEAVTPASPVYVRFTVNGGTVLGAFRASADTARAALLSGAQYLTTAGIGGLAKLRLNLPSIGTGA